MPIDVRSPHTRARGLIELAKTLALAARDPHRRPPHALATNVSAAVRDVFARRKTAVDAGSTTDADYASSLGYDELAADFAGSMVNVFVFDTIKQYAMQIARKMQMVVAMQATVGSVTGEGAPKPVAANQWALAAPEPFKGTVILVGSDELLRSAFADRAFTAEARKGAGVAADSQVLSIAKNGASSEVPTGTDAAALLVNLGATIAHIPTTATSVLLGYTSPTLIKRIATLPSASGNGEPAFGDFSATAGGVIAGINIMPSDAIAYDNTVGSDLVIVDATQCIVVDEGFQVRVSREATLQLNDAPVTDASMVATSLFQQGMTALLVERIAAFAKARANAVAVLVGANYGG